MENVQNYIGIINQPLPTKDRNQFNVKLKCIQPYPRYNKVLQTQHMKVHKREKKLFPDESYLSFRPVKLFCEADQCITVHVI